LARLEADAERHRENRAKELEEERQQRLREQAFHQDALRSEETQEKPGLGRRKTEITSSSS
jgi:hypothetical protein